MENNIFETAFVEKVRFETRQGEISTEELYDLSLESLDKIAVMIDSQLEKTTKSFITNKTASNKILELKLDILKHIIKIKLEAKDAAKIRAERQAKLAQLKALAATKANEQLASQSLEDIEKMISELEE